MFLQEQAPQLTLRVSGYVVRLLSELGPVVSGEIEVSVEGKVDFNTFCLSKPWHFRAWERIAVTQFSNVKARRYCFNRPPHLFVWRSSMCPPPTPHAVSNRVFSHYKYTR